MRRLFLFSLILILTACTEATAALPPPQADAPMLGYHIARGDTEHIRAARAAAGEFVVVVFSWEDIDPGNNRLYWEAPDATLRTAEFYGLEVVARLDRPPEWAKEGADIAPWRLDAYEQFVSKVAARYGDRLAGVIIWNEPNLALEWNQEPPDPVAYTELLKRGYQAVKSAAPELPVLMAGLAFTEESDATAMNDLAFLETVYENGGGDYFDIMAAHPYGFGRPLEAAPDAERLNFRRLELHREMMREYGDEDKPVWITEMGWRTAAVNEADAWQIIDTEAQAEYTLGAIEYAAENYPWLERMAFWELNALGDEYGYDLWHGADDVSLAYERLVAQCERFSPLCDDDPTLGPANDNETVQILGDDVTIRLGDRGTLHPHWVHLHRGGQNFSPSWRGEFFLTEGEAAQEYDLLLELMQIDQPTSDIYLNGTEIGTIATRTRPDPTSTWVSQRFSVPPDLLQPGSNTLEIETGLRNPVRQYSFWRWENFQFRDVKLVPPLTAPQTVDLTWEPQPSPTGWTETNRLRRGLDDDSFWLTSNRPGEIYRGEGLEMANQALNRADAIFTDVLPLEEGILAATDEGLLWRDASSGSEWETLTRAPQSYGYVVHRYEDAYYAGFEDDGLWRATSPDGRWQQVPLPEEDLTVLDLAVDGDLQLYAATNNGVYVLAGRGWTRLPPFPGDTGSPIQRFVPRLYLADNGDIIARNADQLWQFFGEGGTWRPVGPPELHRENKVYSVVDCCGEGTLIGTNYAGLWRDTGDDWTRLDETTFTVTDISEFLRVGEAIYAGGFTTLLRSEDDGDTWQKVEGQPSVISDLLIDPSEPSRWLAGTPAGVYRSEDSGETWQRISEPWTVWDMALGAEGRLYVARTSGIAFADDLSAAAVDWQQMRGLEIVLFFSVNPHPTQQNILLAGTWGNDLGVSYNGGAAMDSINNGLETLSVLDVLYHPAEGQLTIATIEGLFRTDDAGETWFKLPGPLTQQTIHNLHQTADETIWAAAADGLWRSEDYGATWQRVADIPNGTTILRLGEVEWDGATWLWAGTEERGLWLSDDGGASWRFGGLEGLSIYNLLVVDDTLIAATNRGVVAGR